MIIRVFHSSGSSKVTIGVTLCRRACSEANFSVVKIQIALLELVLIVGRNVTED